MVMKIRREKFTGTLPLNVAQVTAQLAALNLPNTYLDALQQGVPVGVDTNGEAKVADGGTAGDWIGLIVTGAKDNVGIGSPYCLANKQITYITGPAEVETDVVVGGVAYNPGDLLYAGTTGNLGLLTKTAPTDTVPRAKVLIGRASGATTTLVILLL
jgi:hypothetical protein